MRLLSVSMFLYYFYIQVKDTQFSWKETRRTLRKDPRWAALDVLDKDNKETMFDEHIREITEKRKKSFRKLLEETDVRFLRVSIIFKICEEK